MRRGSPASHRLTRGPGILLDRLLPHLCDLLNAGSAMPVIPFRSRPGSRSRSTSEPDDGSRRFVTIRRWSDSTRATAGGCAACRASWSGRAPGWSKPTRSSHHSSALPRCRPSTGPTTNHRSRPHPRTPLARTTRGSGLISSIVGELDPVARTLSRVGVRRSARTRGCQPPAPAHGPSSGTARSRSVRNQNVHRTLHDAATSRSGRSSISYPAAPAPRR